LQASAGKIVVVGASGFSGGPTVSALVRTVGADSVVVATRNPSSAAATGFKELGATVVAGDLNDVEGLKAVFAGARAVYIIAPGTEVRPPASVMVVVTAVAVMSLSL
jgi:uncharacterized protein YbjT (DUF2867 family)